METFKELKEVLKAYLNDETVDIKDIDSLYELSCKTNVLGVVSYVLNKSNISDDRFSNYLYKASVKYEKRINEIDNISNVLNKHNIDYVFLKGISIAKYYKEAYLRNSSDIDIVIKDRFEEAKAIFERELNYKCTKSSKQEYSLINKMGVSVDLHRYFLPDELDYEYLFKDKFNNTHTLDNDYTYIFFIIHLAKHMKYGGELQYRSFIDLYYLRNNINKDTTDNVLNSINLKVFSDNMNHYLDNLLELNKKNENDEIIEEFIDSYIKDKGISNRIASTRKQSKLGYILYRVFLPYEEMRYEYPILNKYKILLPICHIRRVFRILKSNRKEYALNEMKRNITLGSDSKNYIERLLK